MKYSTGIGVMSGTSLDGIDLTWCKFSEEVGNWHYEIIKADTYPYTQCMREQLAHATELSAVDYCKLNVTLGKVIAEHIREFIGNRANPDFIASHGHTVFHQPNDGLTTQIGSGAVIAAETGITTVCDFRTLDVALHGQGAPLVPMGDQLLFGQYDACLNLGGFSNISFQQFGQRIAFDISPCNMALNHLAEKMGLDFDKDGQTARSGDIIPELLQKLNLLPYYQTSPPKSLGKEWFEHSFLPLLRPYLLTNLHDCLRTTTEHIAIQIASALPDNAKNLFITGGGAKNKFLIELLQRKWKGELLVPDEHTIDYKEALIFCFLGMLRLERKINCLSSVTGASENCCGGAVYFV